MIENCKHPPGVMIPLVDLNGCEGKGPCVPACPYDVLEMRPITMEEQKQLSFKGRIKTFVHGKHKTFAVKVDLCQGCGKCVAVCPEHAIKLRRV
jgi:4Fe-4S ferredoxin